QMPLLMIIQTMKMKTFLCLIMSCAVWSSTSILAATHTVTFGSFFFNPNSLTINAGDTVVWTGSAHTVTGTGSDPICGNATVSGSCSRTFTTPGTYPYICILDSHAALGMTGTVIVQTSANTPPSVTITNPVNGAVFAAPANVTIQATATDTDGSVTNIQFFANTSLVGADITAPYGIVASNLAAGSYALKAVAVDNGGLSSTPAVVNISVVTPVSVTLSPPLI